MAKKKKSRCKTTALIVDGSYARIQGRALGGKVDFTSLRTELEGIVNAEFQECWYFDSVRRDARDDCALASEYHALKFARPLGPQFQVEVFSTKKYKCHCLDCGNRFMQNVQKGVDNAIATKLMSLTSHDHVDRVILLSGDGDFYSSLNFVRNVLRKEVWVVGFNGTVSGDLQQLATNIVWVNGMWDRVKFRGRGDRDRRPDVARSYPHVSSRSRRRHSPLHHHSDHRRERFNRRDRREGTLHNYAPPKRHRTSSPPRMFNLPRSRSPQRNDTTELVFDEVNLSSDDEDTWALSSPLAPADSSGESQDGEGAEDKVSHTSVLRVPDRLKDEDAAKIREGSAPVLHSPSSTQLSFPLPMPVPVTMAPTDSTSTLSTSSAATSAPRPLFSWAFSENV